MNNVSSAVLEAFTAKLNETVTKCQPFVKKPLPQIKLIFKQLGRRAGDALYDPLTGDATVRINSDFLVKYYDRILNQTLPHEVSHIVAHFAFGPLGRGHGPAWKMACGWAGIPVIRCHDMSLEGVKVKQFNKPYQYACKCQKWNFTLKKHTGLQRPGRWCKCLKCRSRLNYEGFTKDGRFYPKAPSVPVNPTPVPRTILVTIENGTLKTEKIQPTEPPKPIEPPKPQYKLVARFIDGSLQNVRIPA